MSSTLIIVIVKIFVLLTERNLGRPKLVAKVHHELPGVGNHRYPKILVKCFATLVVFVNNI